MTVLLNFGMKLLFALLVLLIGLKIIKYISRPVKDGLEKRDVDPSLRPFLLSLLDGVLKVLLFITIASMLGVKMTSFVAIVGAASLAVGMALQGSLSNFAGGVLILLLKPFRVGDYIEGAGYSGTVEEIQIFYTHLKTPDNRLIVIPNGDLSNNSIVNYSSKSERRVDLTFGVGYDNDIDKVKNAIREVIDSHELIMKIPEPFIRVGSHGDSSVNFVVRVWTKAEDYWTVHFDLLEMVKNKFDKEKIDIPYPHMDVNIMGNK